MGLRVDDALLSFGMSTTSYKVESFPLKYPKLPLCRESISIGNWDVVTNHIPKRLALWKGSLVSRVSSLVLIKATLSSIPIYYMSLFAMPIQVQKNIEGLMRLFF